MSKTVQGAQKVCYIHLREWAVFLEAAFCDRVI